MKTPQEIQDHKDAIALAFARDPKSVVFTGPTRVGSPANLSMLHDSPFSYTIRPQLAIAPGNNPHGLTVEQVGEGFRLLEKDELKRRAYSNYIDSWLPIGWQGGNAGCFDDSTYRTRLSRQQLALLDKGEGWIPWFGEGEVPTGRVEVILNDGLGASTDKNTAEWWATEGFRNNWFIDDSTRIIAYRPVKQPQYVPWNRETCPTLPFEVRRQNDGNRFCVLSATESQVWVGNYGLFDYLYLHKNFTLPDGSPCGTKGEA